MLDFGGAYRPAGDGSEVGGDFYDVFQTGPRTWGIVLGDVCGKGAAAAVVTALARYTVRPRRCTFAHPPRYFRVCTERCSPTTRTPSARCCSWYLTRCRMATG
jgi:hypothetical protein